MIQFYSIGNNKMNVECHMRSAFGQYNFKGDWISPAITLEQVLTNAKDDVKFYLSTHAGYGKYPYRYKVVRTRNAVFVCRQKISIHKRWPPEVFAVFVQYKNPDTSTYPREYRMISHLKNNSHAKRA